MGCVDTTRRDFLKFGALAGAGALGAGMLAGCTPQQQNSSNASMVSADEVKWDGLFDVVVIGFGAAGASAAIAAAEKGATVLIADKAPEGHEGGNSRYCAQLFVSIDDEAEGLKHYQALRGSFEATSDDVLQAYVQGMHGIKDTLTSWGADASKMFDLTDKKISNLTVEYPELEGSTAVRTNTVDGTLMRAGMWRFLKKAVVARKDKIDCWYESPGTALIQDPATKTILGVQFDHDGKKVNIAAKNGVVMALGGFEASSFYTETYLGYPKIFPIGTLFNEGDGIRMAQAAGAKLWHMNAWESNGAGLAEQADRVRNLGTIAFWSSGSVILVGGDARRYLAEDLEQRHGHVQVGGTWMIPSRPERNIFICDAAHIAAGKPYANWSDGCVDEIASGKLVEAATLAELATAMTLDADALQATVDMYNASAESGVDAFGREAANMTPLGSGPYYAIEMWPSVLNTQGGPERSAQGEVVGATDEPIPHLYSAGEFGGVTSNLYQGGGNLAECIVFGKISGENAANAKDDGVSIEVSNPTFTSGCGEESIYDQEPDASGLGTGEAVGIGEGLGGPVWVKVSASGSTIQKVEVLHQSETEGVGTDAIQELPERIVAAGSIEVDAVSGATFSSEALIGAVKDAQSKLS